MGIRGRAKMKKMFGKKTFQESLENAALRHGPYLLVFFLFFMIAMNWNSWQLNLHSTVETAETELLSINSERVLTYGLGATQCAGHAVLLTQQAVSRGDVGINISAMAPAMTCTRELESISASSSENATSYDSIIYSIASAVNMITGSLSSGAGRRALLSHRT